MKYYGVYKITNLVNGKMYIGQHVTSDLDDGYMGSGLVIRRAIKKYGAENFRKEWLTFCEDEEELDYMERVFVDETWLSRSDTYNLKLGGDGGWAYINEHNLTNTPEMRAKLSEKMKGNRYGCFKRSKETRRRMSVANKGKQLTHETKRKLSIAHTGKKVDEETRKKISESSQKKRWYNDGAHETFTEVCPNGFVKGRLHKGWKHSDEAKRLMAESKKRYWDELRKSR